MGIADGPTEVHKVTVAKQVLGRTIGPDNDLFPSYHIPKLQEAARDKHAGELEALKQHYAARKNEAGHRVSISSTFDKLTGPPGRRPAHRRAGRHRAAGLEQREGAGDGSSEGGGGRRARTALFGGARAPWPTCRDLRTPHDPFCGLAR